MTHALGQRGGNSSSLRQHDALFLWKKSEFISLVIYPLFYSV
jgi:hypothetical protein